MITLTLRQATLVLAAVAAISAVVAAAVTIALNPGVAGAQQAHSSATAVRDRAVVNELRKLQRTIGTSQYLGMRNEIRGGFDKLTGAIADQCRALAEDDFRCPSG